MVHDFVFREGVLIGIVDLRLICVQVRIFARSRKAQSPRQVSKG